MTVLFEPASAIAAGLCMTARIIAKGVTTRHPRACAWCDWPVDELGKLIAGFNEWAGYDERRGTYSRFDASVFQGLPRAEQERLVVAAQAFEAVETPTPPPSRCRRGGTVVDAGMNRGGGVDTGGRTPRLGPHGSRVPGDTGSNGPAR
jgi:hypothetical protein